jgi:hypothetical protein
MRKSDDKKFSYYIEQPPIHVDIETFFANYAFILPPALHDHLADACERP